MGAEVVENGEGVGQEVRVAEAVQVVGGGAEEDDDEEVAEANVGQRAFLVP